MIAPFDPGNLVLVLFLTLTLGLPLTLITIGFFLAIRVHATLAQKTGKDLSVIYSSGINGEVDPCPT